MVAGPYLVGNFFGFCLRRREFSGFSLTSGGFSRSDLSDSDFIGAVVSVKVFFDRYFLSENSQRQIHF